MAAVIIPPSTIKRMKMRNASNLLLPGGKKGRREEDGETSVGFEYCGSIFPKSAAIDRNSSRREPTVVVTYVLFHPDTIASTKK